MESAVRDRIEARLQRLYGQDGGVVAERLVSVVESRRQQMPPPSATTWNETDAVLITYGDQISADGETPLQTLRSWLCRTGLNQLIHTVHILPFSPYSSDDGFSVIDYRRVDPALGTWDDITALGEHVNLMFDLVLNHCSQESEWFQAYLRGEEPYIRYFIEADPAVDLSGVTRPRSLPLLHEFTTSRGPRHIWTTFSRDQVDLNFADPDVLIEMIDILLFYAQQGARIIRLDAIAYLWRELGPPCIHLPQTHEVVKLMRDVLEVAAPGTWLLTETNVPHVENVSYFGERDEAHLVYNFSLPPLLLEAFVSEDVTYLQNWLADLEYPAGTAYFNFTASHDGVGVRPLEGLVPAARFEQLIAAMRERGAFVNTKRDSNGNDSPYELNITYFDAFSDPVAPDADLHAQRFLASQAIMLFLRGIPGIYFHSLVGTPNDHDGVLRTKQNRSINRRKFREQELEDLLADQASAQRQVLDGYQQLLRTRQANSAFHPDAPIEVTDVGSAAVLAFTRHSLEDGQRLLIVANVSGRATTIRLPDENPAVDLLTGSVLAEPTRLAPYQVRVLQMGSTS